MLTLTEPQVWVLIGVFATAMFGMLSWQTASFHRALRTSIEGLDRSFSTRIDALRETIEVRFGAIDGRIGTIETRIGAVETRIGTLEDKIDDLDRDVQALTRHVFGAGSA